MYDAYICTHTYKEREKRSMHWSPFPSLNCLATRTARVLKGGRQIVKDSEGSCPSDQIMKSVVSGNAGRESLWILTHPSEIRTLAHKEPSLPLCLSSYYRKFDICSCCTFSRMHAVQIEILKMGVFFCLMPPIRSCSDTLKISMVLFWCQILLRSMCCFSQ